MLKLYFLADDGEPSLQTFYNKYNEPNKKLPALPDEFLSLFDDVSTIGTINMKSYRASLIVGKYNDIYPIFMIIEGGELVEPEIYYISFCRDIIHYSKQCCKDLPPSKRCLLLWDDLKQLLEKLANLYIVEFAYLVPHTAIISHAFSHIIDMPGRIYGTQGYLVPLSSDIEWYLKKHGYPSVMTFGELVDRLRSNVVLQIAAIKNFRKWSNAEPQKLVEDFMLTDYIIINCLRGPLKKLLFSHKNSK